MILRKLISQTVKRRHHVATALLFLKMSVRACHPERSRKARTFLSVLILLFSMLTVKSQNSENYPITDPRNPHCPCHKHQKLADEEYARKSNNGHKGNGEFVGRANSRESKIHKTRIEKYRRQKHRIKDKMHRQPWWIYKFKNWDIWKRATHPIKCPVWNK